MSENPDHSSELKRVNRIIGQLEGVKRMISDQVYCPEILVQTKAISSALRSLETTMLERHIQHCVKNSFKPGGNSDKKIDELVALFKTRIK